MGPDREKGNNNMADGDCTKACKDAYGICVQNCSTVLTDCLAGADTDNKKTECKERFKRCMQRCKEAREICLAACED